MAIDGAGAMFLGRLERVDTALAGSSGSFMR